MHSYPLDWSNISIIADNKLYNAVLPAKLRFFRSKLFYKAFPSYYQKKKVCKKYFHLLQLDSPFFINK